MPKKPKDLTDFQSQTLSFLESNTPFNNVFPGSTIRSISDIINLQMSQLSSDVSELSYNSFLDTAGGHYLDLIGDMFNVARYYPGDYITTEGDKNIKFFTNNTITLARALGSNSIPSGTTVTSSDGQITMTVLDTVNFSDTATKVFVSAKLNRASNNYSIGPNQISQHSLGASNIFVTNTSPIFYSGVVESDDSYRDRISNAVTSFGGANESTILSIIRSFPDVASVDIRQGVSGSGSYDVYLLPTGNRVSQTTMNRVYRLLGDFSGFGITYNVREYDYIPIKVEVKVSFLNNVSDNLKSSIMNQAENAVQGLVGDIRPREKLSMSRIVSTVMNIAPSISSAEVVYLCIDKRIRAITDLVLKDDELFVPDEDEINPIMVRQ